MHLIIRSNHADRHPVGVPADAECVAAAVCHRGNILLIAERKRKGKKWQSENWAHFKNEEKTAKVLDYLLFL